MDRWTGQFKRSGKRDASVVSGFRRQSLRHAQVAAPISYGLVHKAATMLQLPDEDSRFDQIGTNADAGLIREFLRAHGKSSKDWIAGHLIAAAFGGSGTDPRNITPLPKTANRQHAAVEAKVREAHNAMCEFFSQTVVKRYSDVLWALRYVVLARGVASRTLEQAAQDLQIRMELCEFAVTRDGDGRPAVLSTSYVPIRAEKVAEKASQIMRTIGERWRENQGQDVGSRAKPRMTSLQIAPIVEALSADGTAIAVDLDYPNPTQGESDLHVVTLPQLRPDEFFNSLFPSTSLMDEATNPTDDLPYDPNDGGEWTGFKKSKL